MDLNKLTTVMFAILFALGIAGCEREQPADQPGGTMEQAPTAPDDTTAPPAQSPPAGGEQPGGGMGGGAGQP